MGNEGYGYNENCIEWLKDEKQVTLTITQRKLINKIEKYALINPDCVIKARNEDGSICAHIPLSWIKMSPPKKTSDEQRQRARESMQALHTKRGTTPRNKG